VAGTRTQFKVFERERMQIADAFQQRDAAATGGHPAPLWIGRIFETMFLGNFILPTSLVMRRTAAMSIGKFLDMRTQEDYEYLLRFARQYPMAFVDVPQVSYRRHATQLTSFDRVESIVTAAASIVDGYEPEFRASGRATLFNRRKAGLAATLGAVHLRKGASAAARASIREAIVRAPLQWRAYLYLALSFVPPRLIAALRGR
jgi:hypothetical protein